MSDRHNLSDRGLLEALADALCAMRDELERLGLKVETLKTDVAALSASNTAIGLSMGHDAYVGQGGASEPPAIKCAKPKLTAIPGGKYEDPDERKKLIQDISKRHPNIMQHLADASDDMN